MSQILLFTWLVALPILLASPERVAARVAPSAAAAYLFGARAQPACGAGVQDAASGLCLVVSASGYRLRVPADWEQDSDPLADLMLHAPDSSLVLRVAVRPAPAGDPGPVLAEILNSLQASDTLEDVRLFNVTQPLVTRVPGADRAISAGLTYTNLYDDAAYAGIATVANRGETAFILEGIARREALAADPSVLAGVMGSFELVP